MKNSIKVLLISLTLCFMLSFSACSQGVSTTLNGSYFLQNVGNVNIIGNVDETNVYKVSFKKASNLSTSMPQISLEEADGFNVYTTHLKNGEYNGTSCYILDTELKIKINYLYGEESNTYDDYVKTKVYFLSVSNKLKPLYSETEADAHSPVTDKNGKYEIVNLKYKFTTTYQDNSAVVDFTKTTGDFGIPEGKREYSNLSSGYYFDNATMLFMPRAIKLTDSSSLTFSSIDAISGTNRTMIMKSDTTKPNENLIFSLSNSNENVINGVYYINDKKEFLSEDKASQVIACQIVNFNVSGTFSGSAIKCWYANVSQEVAKARLIKMETTAPYSLGTFTYVIEKTTENA